MKDGTIHRHRKERNYSIIPNDFLQRTDMSMKAKCLLAYLLTLPDDWKIYVRELRSHFKEGINTIYTAINELIEKGYVVKEAVERESGKFAGVVYHVYEDCRSENVTEQDGLKSQSQPRHKKPYAVNQTLLITNLTNNKDLSFEEKPESERTRQDYMNKVASYFHERYGDSTFKKIVVPYFKGSKQQTQWRYLLWVVEAFSEKILHADEPLGYMIAVAASQNNWQLFLMSEHRKVRAAENGVPAW